MGTRKRHTEIAAQPGGSLQMKVEIPVGNEKPAAPLRHKRVRVLQSAAKRLDFRPRAPATKDPRDPLPPQQVFSLSNLAFCRGPSLVQKALGRGEDDLVWPKHPSSLAA